MKLTKTIDFFTSLTPDIQEGVKEDSTEDKTPQIDNMVNEGNASVSVVGGTLKIDRRR